MKRKIIGVMLTVAMTFSIAGCHNNSENVMNNQTENPNSDMTTTSEFANNAIADREYIERTSFMDYVTENNYDIVTEPQVAEFQVNSDLSNVINVEDFTYMLEQYPEFKEKLLTNGFVVVDGGAEEFFSLYEYNRYDFTPNFITTDSMLHTYHLYFSHLLKNLEKDYFYNDLKLISEDMVEASLEQYELLKGTEWEAAALRNTAYFSVGMQLLDSNAQADPLVVDLVAQEMALIEGESGIEVSPIMYWENTCDEPLKEDYSQYKVRGYYAEDETLSRYFKAMMWYGRLTFRINSDEETKSALLINRAMKDSEVLTNWNRIYDVTSFFMGNSDDPGLYEYSPVIEEIYAGITVADLPKNEDKWEIFKARLMELEPPVINSIPVYEYEMKESRDNAINGFRFIGQRSTFDASVFQRLIYQNVLADGNGQYRMLPSAMDIPAVLGSKEAEEILTEQGAFGFEKYPENMKEMQETVKAADDDVWKSSLYSNWLNTLRPLVEEKGEGYPAFMQNDAWTRKQLNTFLGSFTELKHDSVLYAKQVYAEMGGGDIDEPDYRGYVEPEPEVYARLALLSKLTKDGLEGYGMLSDVDAENLGLLQELAEQLMVISNKELTGENLTEEEHDLIKSFGGQLEHFWYEALKDLRGDEYFSPQEYPAAVVTDIATNPNGSVLEVGTGAIDRIYVIVDVEGSLRIAVGGVYSFYEFEQPINERLTDKEWRIKLGLDFPENDNGMPDFSYRTEDVEQPEWVNAFKVDLY